MMLIAYDGSEDARAAIENAASLMPGATASVITVWEPFIDALMRSSSLSMGLEYAGGVTDTVALDRGYAATALSTATEGSERARAAGLRASPHAVRRSGGIGQTIARYADERHADAIVIGTRGLGALKSFMLGSVSHAVVQHASMAVLIARRSGGREGLQRVGYERSDRILRDDQQGG